MTEQEALMLAQAGIDESGTLLIDADTRSIYVPESEKFFGVESDQNVERKKFKCPKIVGDNIDLSTLHLYINYQNGNGNKDSYMIQDMAVSGEYITFSWVLSRNVAEYKGTVRFVFCAKKADSSGNLVNEWNTTVAEGEVIEGLEATVTVADNNPDIIEQMLTLLKNVSDEPVFTEARTRENVTNGDKVPVLWGKVKKWFADLGTAAFCKVVNNLTTAAEGGVLDARQGKELNDALAKLNKLMGNTDISGIGNGTVTGALLTLNSKAPRGIITGTTTLEEYCSKNKKLPGEYRINGAIIPEISTTEKFWGVLILSAVFDTQIVIIAGGKMYIRDYTGNPNVWSGWKKYTYANLS